MSHFPKRADLVVQFAHVAYQFETRFAVRETGIRHYQTWTPKETIARIGEADIVIATGFWRNELLEAGDRLKFIQVCGAGYDQFDANAIGGRGIKLANASGCNTNAVAEHALALILGLTRQLHGARDNQRKRHWRGMIGEIERREEEVAGKTLLIFGAGAIGARVATLAKAFGMRVEGCRRDPAAGDAVFDAVHPSADFLAQVPRADIVMLCCPLTPETANIVDAEALALMKADAYLINVARGGCVEEGALVDTLRRGAIAGAGIDTTDPEPLCPDSALWDLDNVLLTPHTAGETRGYEDSVIDILIENIERLERGDSPLVNEIV